MATSNALPSLTFYTNPLVRVPAPAALDAAIRPTQERASLADSLQQRKGAGIVMRANREQATRRSLARRPQKAHRWQPQPVRSTIRVRGYVWVVLPQAFNPAKVALMLAEKGFPHRTVKVDLFAGGNLTPEFLKMSPKGWTPVLVVDDKVRATSALTLQLPALVSSRLSAARLRKQCARVLRLGSRLYSVVPATLRAAHTRHRARPQGLRF